jgi:uncharacterized protein (TIRG00374 family)
LSGLDITILDASSLQPAATLIGAASMIPGGIGTTEAALALLLGRLSVDPVAAVGVAVTFRLATLWFAVGLGILATHLLERWSRTDGAEIESSAAIRLGWTCTANGARPHENATSRSS